MRAGRSLDSGRTRRQADRAQPLMSRDRAAEISVLLRASGRLSPPLWYGRSLSRSFRPALLGRPDKASASSAAASGGIRFSRSAITDAARFLSCRQPPGLTENIVLCAGDDGQDDFRTACADAAAADGDAGHDNYLTEKRYFHHTACPAACQACRSKNRKQVVFCGNLHLRDGRKSFTISASKAVRPAWGCAAFFVLGGKENEGNKNDCAGAGGLSGS